MRKTIKIRCITNEMVYNSAREAAEALGLHRSNITACCTGRRKHCNGMEFEYADPDHIRHKRKWRRLTYDEKNRLVKLYKTGVPLKEIAKEIGIHPQSISAILRRRKVSRNRYFRTSM